MPSVHVGAWPIQSFAHSRTRLRPIKSAARIRVLRQQRNYRAPPLSPPTDISGSAHITGDTTPL